MGNQLVTDFEMGWIVGIFEGEGCWTLSKQGDYKITPGVKLVNTNVEIINDVSEILKRLQIGHFIYDAWRTKNQQPAKRLEINGLLRIKKFLDFYFPHAKCRICQPRILKEFVELRLSKGPKEPYSDHEHSLYHMLRELNKTGTSETTREVPKNLFDGLR